MNQELVDTFGVPGVVGAYGLTEFPNATCEQPDDPSLGTTIGPVGTGVEARVVDGELQLRGPQCFLGYADPGLDEAGFDDCWFRTGDLASVDDEGRVRITGRLKDVIIRNAENISASEVEEVVLGHPDVHDVAVVGIPDTRTGERVCAVVVLAPNAALDVGTLGAHCVAAVLARQSAPSRCMWCRLSTGTRWARWPRVRLPPGCARPLLSTRENAAQLTLRPMRRRSGVTPPPNRTAGCRHDCRAQVTAPPWRWRAASQDPGGIRIKRDDRRVQLSRREANKAKTRAALHDAAVSLFVEKGYDATTVADIAERAETSVRTFFNYYMSKEDVVFENRTDRPSLLVSSIIARPGDELPLTAIRNGLVDSMVGFADIRHDVLLRNRAMESTPILQGRAVASQRAWEDAVAEALARRARRSQASPRDRLYAAVAMSVLADAMREWTQRHADCELADLIAERFTYLGEFLHSE